MQQFEELAKQLLQIPEIANKIKEMLLLKSDILKRIADYSELRWTISQYRAFLVKKFLKKLNKSDIPQVLIRELLINFNEEIDVIIPPSIGDYQNEFWEHTRWTINLFLEKFGFSLQEDHSNEFWDLPNLSFISDQEKIQTIVNNNNKLMQNLLTNNVEENLIERVIFSALGGSKNIKAINLVSYKFNEQAKIVTDGQGYIENYYLKITVYDNKKCQNFNKFLSYHAKELDSYHKFFEFNFFKNKFTLAEQHLQGEIYIANTRFFNDEIIKKNHLILIHNNHKNINLIKKIIKNWNDKNNQTLTNTCIKEIVKQYFENHVNKFNHQFQENALWIRQKYYHYFNLCDILKKFITYKSKISGIKINNYYQLKLILFKNIEEK